MRIYQKKLSNLYSICAFNTLIVIYIQLNTSVNSGCSHINFIVNLTHISYLLYYLYIRVNYNLLSDFFPGLMYIYLNQ